MAVVGSVDADRLEARGHRVDLAQEVLRGEAPLAQGVRRRVRCRREAGARRHQLAEQACHHHRVARIVEFELVDAEQIRPAEQVDGVLVAEGAHERGVLDERAEVLPAHRHRVIDRRQQVGLADAEAAVEVDARLELGPLLRPAEESAAGLRCGQPGERHEGGLGLLLRGERRVRTVGLERRVLELRRRDEGGDHLGTGDLRGALGEVNDSRAGRGGCHPADPVSPSYGVSALPGPGI